MDRLKGLTLDEALDKGFVTMYKSKNKTKEYMKTEKTTNIIVKFAI